MKIVGFFIWLLLPMILLNGINAQNTSVVKMALDTMDWKDYTSGKLVNTEIEEYKYNSNEELTYAILSYWSNSSQSYEYQSRIYTIHAEGQVDSKIYSEYDHSTYTWKDTLMRKYTYNTKGELSILEIMHRNSNDEEWQWEAKEDYIYDGFGNMTELYFSTWNNDLNKWEYIEKDSLVYDTSNKIQYYTSWTWDFLLDEWLYFDKEEYKFENGWSKYSYSEWNEINNQWEYVFKDSSIYSSDGSMYAYHSCYWKKSQSAWINFSKEVHSLNTNGQVLLYTEYEWNESLLRWDYYDKEEYNYDAYGNVRWFVDYNKTPEYNIWIESLKEIYTYDNLYPLDQLILPYDEAIINGVYFNTMMMTIDAYEWSTSLSNWRDVSKGSFIYSQFNPTTASIANNENDITIYPIPFNNQLTITGLETGHVTFYDSSGHICYQKNIESKTQSFNLLSLKPGIYLVQIYNKGLFSFKKVVKK